MKIKILFSITFVILFLFGIVFGFFYFLFTIPTNIIPFVAAGIGFVVSRIYEYTKENKSRLYDKKREVYLKIIRPWKNVLIMGKDAKVEMSSEFTQEQKEAGLDLILYGNDDVIKQYGQLRNAGSEVSPDLYLVKFAKLLKGMRKDLGYTFSSLNAKDILEVFINFTDEEKTKYTKIKI